jgi:hypothetical protein
MAACQTSSQSWLTENLSASKKLESCASLILAVANHTMNNVFLLASAMTPPAELCAHVQITMTQQPTAPPAVLDTLTTTMDAPTQKELAQLVFTEGVTMPPRPVFVMATTHLQLALLASMDGKEVPAKRKSQAHPTTTTALWKLLELLKLFLLA